MRLSLLSLLSLITFGCQPDFAKVDPVDNDPNNTEEPSSEPSTDPTDTDTSEPDTIDPTEDPNVLRCCYGIEMYDQMGDGWQRSPCRSSGNRRDRRSTIGRNRSHQQITVHGARWESNGYSCSAVTLAFGTGFENYPSTSAVTGDSTLR